MKRVVQKIRKTWSILRKKEDTILSAGLSFYMILSLLPLAILTLMVLSFIGIGDSVYDYVPEGFHGLLDVLRQASINKRDSIFYLLSALYGASILFYYFIRTSGIAYGMKRKKGNLVYRAFCILGILLFLAVMILLLEFYLVIVNFLSHYFLKLWVDIISYFMILVVTFSLILVAYLFMAPFHVRIKDVMKGAITCFIGILIFSYGFKLYYRYFSHMNELYGAFTSFIVFFLYLYFVIQIFFIGLRINIYTQRETKKYSIFWENT